MMKKNTKDYDMFIFRDDNRAQIDQSHVRRLVQSITSRNLLELRPITVNGKMEIIDGQHRLLAAKEMGIDIWYVVQDDLDAQDILKMNISKNWLMADYFNFYVHHGYPEYIKLTEFMKKEGLNLQVSLNLIYGRSLNKVTEFKEGKFAFKEQVVSEQIEICKDTIETINKVNGYCPYTKSIRFWKALITVFSHPDFEKDQWYKNLSKMASTFGPRVSGYDYINMFAHAYNYRSPMRIEFNPRKSY